METITKKIIDPLDLKILDLLQKESQLTNTEIAKIVNLSPPATHARIKRLHKEGYIQKHVAILDAEKLGFDLLSFVFISSNNHKAENLDVLEKALFEMEEVLECHCITGEYDYLLKVANKDRKSLEGFVRKLNKLGITQMQTSLALREVKYSNALPILHEKERNNEHG
ncbi:Lrp/AsnC family transcriptional regulator [Alkalihalobacterium bogoriense]|uniref:Lrp/AsnC family transcriptional regulator n=1 Tax=Alkalihalobacterium bogoriense TaxID=246272 RepID=UPI00047D5C25|nr:Lrp/AsnC family transcriptional regulator [Alkalihalobacterium bogoriense]